MAPIAGVVAYWPVYHIIAPVFGWILWAFTGGLYRPPDRGLTHDGAVLFVTFICISIAVAIGGVVGWITGAAKSREDN